MTEGSGATGTTPLQTMEEMLRSLIEDRQRREAEIASERRRQEEAREAREREVKQQMELMQANVERLMKMVETSQATKADPTGAGKLNIKLVPLSEKDDIEAYLVTFERIMTAHKVEESCWPHYLASQLTGRAQLAFAALPIESSANYKAIKEAVLKRYDINEESYRRRFRSERRCDGETNRELAIRLMDTQRKWTKQCKTVEELQEFIGIEQFMNTLTPEKRAWVFEKKPKSCREAGELADEYEQVRKQGPEASFKKPRDPDTGDRVHARKPGTGNQAPKWQQTQKTGQENTGIQCFQCSAFGHIARECPEKEKPPSGGGNTAKKMVQDRFTGYSQGPRRGPKQKGRGIYRSGEVEGQPVKDIVLDTGCSRTMVHRKLVPPEKIREGEAVVRCVHGDTVLHPLAEIKMEVDGETLTVEAAVSETLPVSALLGTDVEELANLLGTSWSGPATPQDSAMMVVTRAQARRPLEEEIRRKEKELLSGDRAKPIIEDDGTNSKGTDPPATLTQEQRRELRQCGAEEAQAKPNSVPQHELEISAGELQELQEADNTRVKIRPAADGHPCSAGEGFFRRDGLLYKRWTPPGRGEECEVEQLVLPSKCRKKKTRQRIMRRFYWPTVYKDVEEFCKSCSNKKMKPAPLVPLPVISEPFKRVAMDIVGPLPRRVPEEILTDQGSNFMYQLLAELYSLLHIHSIHTSPYHPIGYYSRKLLSREERYSTVEKECLAIKLGIQAFRVYLLGKPFTIQTDHRSLEWLDRLKENNAGLTGWSLALQPYSFTVEHRAGSKNGNADALSRVTTN